jgi:hypothetical protein
MIKNLYWYSWKVTVILVRFNESWTFPTRIQKNKPYQILWKYIQWVANCSTRIDTQTHGRTDRYAKTKGRFRSFARELTSFHAKQIMRYIFF